MDTQTKTDPVRNAGAVAPGATRGAWGEAVALVGYAAIEEARRTGRRLRKYADPIEGVRKDLTPDDAEEVAREDPALIYLPVRP